MEIFLLLVAGICTAALYFALTSSAEDGENVGKFDRNQSYEKSSMIDDGVISAAVQEFDNSPPTGELLDCSCSEIDYSQSRARESRSECIANDFYNCVEQIFSEFQVGWQALPLNPSDSDFFFRIYCYFYFGPSSGKPMWQRDRACTRSSNLGRKTVASAALCHVCRPNWKRAENYSDYFPRAIDWVSKTNETMISR